MPAVSSRFHPWQDYEAPFAEHFVGSFVDCVIAMQQCLKSELTKKNTCGMHLYKITYIILTL